MFWAIASQGLADISSDLGGLGSAFKVQTCTADDAQTRMARGFREVECASRGSVPA